MKREPQDEVQVEASEPKQPKLIAPKRLSQEAVNNDIFAFMRLSRLSYNAAFHDCRRTKFLEYGKQVDRRLHYTIASHVNQAHRTCLQLNDIPNLECSPSNFDCLDNGSYFAHQRKNLSSGHCSLDLTKSSAALACYRMHGTVHFSVVSNMLTSIYSCFNIEHKVRDSLIMSHRLVDTLVRSVALWQTTGLIFPRPSDFRQKLSMTSFRLVLMTIEWKSKMDQTLAFFCKSSVRLTIWTLLSPQIYRHWKNQTWSELDKCIHFWNNTSRSCQLNLIVNEDAKATFTL